MSTALMLILLVAALLAVLPCYWLAPGIALGIALLEGRTADERFLGSIALGFALPPLLVPWSRFLGLPYKEIWLAASVAAYLVLIVQAVQAVSAARAARRLPPGDGFAPTSDAPVLTAAAVVLLLVGYVWPASRFLAPPRAGHGAALDHGTADLQPRAGPFHLRPHLSRGVTGGLSPGIPRPDEPGRRLARRRAPRRTAGGGARPLAGTGGALSRREAGGARSSTAVAALLVGWLARNPQAHMAWGGNPSVLGTALAFVALRWVLDVPPVPSRRPAVAAILVLAAVPLVHSAAALICAYLAPLVLVVLGVSGRVPVHRRTIIWLAAVGVAALLLVLPQLVATLDVQVSAAEADWLRRFYLQQDPYREGVLGYFVAQFHDALVMVVGMAAVVNLAVRRQLRWEVPLVASLLALQGFAWLASHWLLPGAFALYPERIMLFALPVFVILLRRFLEQLPRASFSFRAAPAPGPEWQLRRRRRAPWLTTMLVVAIAFAAVLNHHRYYVRGPLGMALVRPVDRPALAWAAGHLEPGTAVASSYNDAGIYLPACAGVAVTSPQTNPVWFEEMRRSIAALPLSARYVGAASAALPASTAAVYFLAAADGDTALITAPSPGPDQRLDLPLAP